MLSGCHNGTQAQELWLSDADLVPAGSKEEL